MALSPKMKEEVDAEFGIDSVLITKPIFAQPVFTNYPPSFPLKLLYTGNLYVNRDETLAEVVDAIKVINGKDQKVKLDVYTSTSIKPTLQSRICVKDCCEIHGPIQQSEVLKLQKEADVLLFLESLEDDGGGDARLSFSTKITDYFCSGKCIWAVGSQQLSAIDYLKRNEAAICGLTQASILPTLEKLVSESDVIRQYAYRGWKCGRENHNAN